MMTENQRRIYRVMKSDKWMSLDEIWEKSGFEKKVTVAGCIQGLRASGDVECEEQTLLDGTVLKFYRIIKEYEPPVAWFVEVCDIVGFNIYTKKFSSQTEALTFIEEHRKHYGNFYQSRYHLYKGEEVGEY